MDHGIVRSSGIANLHGAQRGWAIHALVYLCVNTGLVALALLQGRTPMLAPALAWGIGLAIHGTVAFLVAGRRAR
ncbi:2TM domain-containing protein [Ramlibacter sp. AN1133]|uniref:2TM domain-containing protein n=1 Tax=Ramlibacter sp. AN1133 TaxID=3133429 RepID=UPI0030C60CAC